MWIISGTPTASEAESESAYQFHYLHCHSSAMMPSLSPTRNRFDDGNGSASAAVHLLHQLAVVGAASLPDGFHQRLLAGPVDLRSLLFLSGHSMRFLCFISPALCTCRSCVRFPLLSARVAHHPLVALLLELREHRNQHVRALQHRHLAR